MAQENDVAEVHVVIGDKMAAIYLDGMYVDENRNYVPGIWRVDICGYDIRTLERTFPIDCETGFHSWKDAMQSAIEHM